MFGHLAGLILLGLGINKSIYSQNPNVMGDSTTATATNIPPQYLHGAPFHLNPQQFATQSPNYHVGTPSGSTGGYHPGFDTRAFGLALIHTDADFAAQVAASRAAAIKEYAAYQTRFHQELVTIKDTAKQGILDKLNTNCQTVNQRRTDAMTGMLTKLTLILTNVTNRAASASAAGKDTTAVTTAITTAQGAIADAQTAVANQSGSVCTITFTSTGSASLKTDVGKTISGLQSVLQSVYAKVIAARKAVSDAIRALAAVTGEPLTLPPTATASGGLH